MITNYIQSHISDKRYIARSEGIYKNILGWTDFCGLPHLVFSHRMTEYTKENFNERLHSHDFFEIVFYLSGSVEYVNRDLVNTPLRGNMIINLPGDAHTTRLISDGIYERYVLYFDKEFLYYVGGELPLLRYLEGISDFVFGFDNDTHERLVYLLRSAETAFEENDELSLSAAYADILSVFAIICKYSRPSDEVRNIPENVLKIKQYIDQNASSIVDVNSLADVFFYSREHLSRIFKRYFNIPVSDYVCICKINRSKLLLRHGMKISTVSELCGFGTQTSFLRAFKKFAKTTPSEYIKAMKINNIN